MRLVNSHYRPKGVDAEQSLLVQHLLPPRKAESGREAEAKPAPSEGPHPCPAGRIRVLVPHHFSRAAVRSRRDPTLELCFIGIGAAKLTDSPLVSKRNVGTMFQPPQTRGSRDGRVRVSRCNAAQTARRQQFGDMGSREIAIPASATRPSLAPKQFKVYAGGLTRLGASNRRLLLTEPRPLSDCHLDLFKARLGVRHGLTVSEHVTLVPCSDDTLAACPELGNVRFLSELGRLDASHPRHQRGQLGAEFWVGDRCVGCDGGESGCDGRERGCKGQDGRAECFGRELNRRGGVGGRRVEQGGMCVVWQESESPQ